MNPSRANALRARVFSFVSVLFLVASSASAQSSAPSNQIRFTEATEKSGIHFSHFKGNKGISNNLEEFGPGVCVADFDGDGWQDIYFVNGRDRYDRGIEVQNALYRNNRDATFIDVTDKAGVPGTGYGLGCVWGDYDNDGFVDIVVANNGDPPTLLSNEGGNSNHFVNFRLVGSKSNRDAMGARIRITAGGISQIREIAGGGSYLSQSDLRANFGLGKSETIDLVEVTWPSGSKQSFRNIPANKFYQITEGSDSLSFQQIVRH